MPNPDETVTPAASITPDPSVQLSETVSRVDFDAQKRDATKYHRRAQDAEKEIDDLKGRALSPENMEKFQALLDREEEDRKEKEEAENRRLAEKGEFETVLKKQQVEASTAFQQLKESTATEIAARDTALATMQRQLMNAAAEAPLLAAMGELGMRNPASAIRLIQDGHTRWDDADGHDWYVGCVETPLPNGSTKMEPVVFDRANEDSAVLKNGERLSVKEFVAKFAASPEGRMRLPAVPDSGTGAHAGLALNGEYTWAALEANDEARWKMQREDPDRYARMHQAQIKLQNRKEDAENPR